MLLKNSFLFVLKKVICFQNFIINKKKAKQKNLIY